MSDGRSSHHVLLSVFACDPLHGSERYVGWQWLKMLSGIHGKLFVLTREYNREFHPADRIPDNVEFIYFDLPFGGSRIGHKARFIKLYYVCWQLFAALRLRRDPRLESVRLVQHVTYNVIDMPGFLWLLRDKIFVWGPVGGGQVPPLAMRRLYPGAAWFKERVRRFLKSTARFNPIVRLAARRAALILFANDDTRRRLDGLVQGHAMMLETAFDGEQVSTDRDYPEAGEELRLLWLSHAEYRKGLMLAIDAIAQARGQVRQRLVLDVVGEGPALAPAREQIARLGLDGCVKVHGRISFDQVSAHMTNAHALLFTSMQDTSGNVLLEAMAAGTPPIAPRHQGAAQILAGGGGMLVDVDTYARTAANFAEAIVAFSMDAPLRESLSLRARERVSEEFSWSAKSAQVETLHRKLLTERANG